MMYKIVKDGKVQEDIIVTQRGHLIEMRPVDVGPHELYEIGDPENYTILRSTEVLDSKSKKIFEGDLVRFAFADDVEKFPDRNIWTEEKIIFKNGCLLLENHGMMWQDEFTYEITGNIHITA